MPKRTADDYAADGGFVVDGNSDDDNDNDAAMDSDEEVATSKSKKSKKQKTASASASAPAGKAAASKSGNGDGGIPGGGAVGKDGAEYWEISGKRRLQLTTYNGKRMVNIREYYEDKKSGDMLPGKKGISLTLEQFDTVITLLPAIESVLKAKGETIAKPDYNNSGSSATGGGGGREAGAGGGAGKEKRRNFEETSEEEE